MIYRKNLYEWEQRLRILIGVAAAIGAVWMGQGALWGYVVAASGLGLALTGLFGFCPACAVAGRKPVAQPIPWKGRE